MDITEFTAPVILFAYFQKSTEMFFPLRAINAEHSTNDNDPKKIWKRYKEVKMTCFGPVGISADGYFDYLSPKQKTGGDNDPS